VTVSVHVQDIRLSETSGWLVSGYGVPRWDCTVVVAKVIARHCPTARLRCERVEFVYRDMIK